MTYNALRKGRYSEQGRAYFITTVTAARYPFFLDLWCARSMVRVLRDLNDNGFVQSLCWVVMPDHVHWLFRLQYRNLSWIMNRMKGKSARSINRRLVRNGPVWQKAYYDRGLRDDDDIKQLARYIIANPLRKGLAKNIGDYPHWDAVWL